MVEVVNNYSINITNSGDPEKLLANFFQIIFTTGGPRVNLLYTIIQAREERFQKKSEKKVKKVAQKFYRVTGIGYIY